MSAKLVTALIGCFIAVNSFAQQPAASPPPSNSDSAMEQRMRELEDRVIALEGQIRMLKAAQAAPAQAAPGQPATPPVTAGEAVPQTSVPGAPTLAPQTQAQAAGLTQEPTLGGAGGSAAKALNPDISVIGDFIGAVGGNSQQNTVSLQPIPAFQMHESEVGFQSIIDPYARGDFFISFGEQGVNLEEGYITFTALPAGFLAKVGKMRSAFGKVNTMHNHVLPWVERPLVSNNLVGGEDGIDDAGVSIERIIPAPKGIFLEGTGQLFRGDSSNVFQSSQRSDVSTVLHLRGYRDISESTNVDLGVSYARGHNDQGSGFLTHLYGVDATLRWKPLRRSIYHSFVGRSEFIWSDRQQLPLTQKSFGYYASADYQLARRWFLGGRFDHSDRSRNDALTDKGGSVVLTYWPSEFSQLRGQYRFTRYANNIDANELFVQLIFSLGAHGAHPF
ncbi:MAG: TonB-dependent receptor [Acidobacteria bacterium]|nr:TonB-dependent receptor [Acidobacteriota bacterium]